MLLHHRFHRPTHHRYLSHSLIRPCPLRSNLKLPLLSLIREGGVPLI
jgi:hypothetical protein